MTQQLLDEFKRTGILVEDQLGCDVPHLVRCHLKSQMCQRGLFEQISDGRRPFAATVYRNENLTRRRPLSLGKILSR